MKIYKQIVDKKIEIIKRREKISSLILFSIDMPVNLDVRIVN